MGYRIAILDADAQAPASQIAEVVVTAPLNDLRGAEALARASDVVTLDTEHVPSDILEQIEAITPVRPGAAVLEVVQDRLRQREFLDSHGLPQVPHAGVDSLDELRATAARIGFPCVLKTRRWGYDGKGQARADSPADLEEAWRTIGELPAVLESFITFDREISALLARGLDGEIQFHPVAENTHRRQ